MMSRKHLFSAALLGASQLLGAQPTTPSSTAPSPASVPAAGVATSSAGNAEALEPRTIRGNDRVVAPAKPSPAVGGAPISLNFEEAPIAEVVRTILGDLLRVDYVLYQPINGTVTLSTRAPVSADQAVYLLESALFANGLALTRDARGSYHVGRPEALRGVSSSVRQASPGRPLPPGSGAIIVPLQYIGATEMASILRPMVPAESLVRVDTVRNLLVLAGSRSQAEGWLDLVNTFDVNLLQGMSVGVFPLKHVSAQEVEAALQLLVAGAAGTAAPGRAPVTPTGTPGANPAQPAPTAQARATNTANGAALAENNPLFGALRVMPIERINSILVVTPRAAYLDEARRWIERFDRPHENSAEPQLHIYRVQNGNSRHLASVLQGIFGGSSGSSAPATSGVAPGLANSTRASTGSLFGNSSNNAGGTGLRFGGMQANATQANQPAATQTSGATTIGNIRVMSDDLNNSILVWGTQAEYNKIEATLKRLDLPPTQVLIEANVIEVTLDDTLRYGLQWQFSDSRTNSSYSGLGMLTNGPTKGTDITPASVFTTAQNGFSYTLKNSLGNVRAILSALSSKGAIKVVSSPSLMVLDNHPASIMVGSQVPVQTATTNFTSGSTGNTNSYEWKDTGVNLSVVPSVNSGNLVSLQIDQTYSEVGSKDEITGQSKFYQRQLSSKVAVRSGETIVMGGLIQERDVNNDAGIPGLHTAPVVGALFGTTTREKLRTELLVVITPKVVRTEVDVREVTDDLRERMKSFSNIESLQPTKPRTVEPARAFTNQDTAP